MTRTSNRRAVTLVEVLIAIFLMGIGLMAILSLFPLGAAQMAQAIQDQRAAEAATTAAAYARVIWKQACDADESNGDAGANRFVDGNPTHYKPNAPYYPAPYDTTALLAPQAQQRFVMAMDDPQWNPPVAQFAMTGASGSSVPGSSSSGPPALPTGGSAANATASYPVILDPIGFQANQVSAAFNQWWVGMVPDTSAGAMPWRIPRRPLYASQPAAPAAPTAPWASIYNPLNPLPMFKQFSLTDDMTFNFGASPILSTNPAGTPKLGNGNPTADPVERQGRYSWAFMFRRGNNADRRAVEITTILYSGRSIDVASQETTYSGRGAVGSKALTLAYSTTKPAIRRGGWVLDATLWDDNAQPAPQGFFYRVVNVDDSTPNLMALELQTPILGGPSVRPRAIVVMDKVVEVFVKKDVSTVAPAMPY